MRLSSRFRRRVALCVTLYALLVPSWAGCGVSGASAPRAAEPEASLDAALELAARLPAGADQCAVTRPGHIEARRRPLVAQVSAGSELAWLSGAPVVAVVTAERYARQPYHLAPPPPRRGAVGADPRPGGRTSVALFRSSGTAEELREFLDRYAPVRLAWDGEACAGPRCRRALRAEVIDRHTVRVTRGDWPAEERAGVEAACLELAMRMPEALEVSSRRGEVVVAGSGPALPRRVDSWLRASTGHLELTRRHTMASEAAARRVVDREAERVRHVLADLGERMWTDVRGRIVSTWIRYAWNDLRLEREAERRLLHAQAGGRSGAPAPVPLDAIDLTNLGAVRYQLRLRERRLEEVTGPARRRQGIELANLLERAWKAHPQELELAWNLARLWLEELERPARTVEVAERVIAERAGVDAWRRVRREALARMGSTELRQALVEDEVVAPRHAAAAAEELATLVRRHVDYRRAEHAWHAVHTVSEHLSGSRLRTVPPAKLPVEALVESLATLATLESPRTSIPPLGSVQLVVWPEDAELASRDVMLRLHDGGGRPALYAESGSDADEPLHRLGLALADAVSEGRVEVAVVLLPLGSGGAGLVVHLGGRIEGDSFIVERASGPASRISWSRVARYLGEPLAGLYARVYPPPPLEIETESPGAARALLTRQAEPSSIECDTEGRWVRCRPRRFGDPAALRGLLALLVAEPLAGDVRHLLR